VTGYICKYTPVEVLAGFGEECSFILPEDTSCDYAESRLWPNLCGYAKATLQDISGGEYGEVIFTDCCDALKRVYDVLKSDSANAEPLYPAGETPRTCGASANDNSAVLPSTEPFIIGLPRANDKAAVRAYADNIMEFIKRYGEHSGKSFDVKVFLSSCRAAGEKTAATGGGYVALMGARAPAALYSAAERMCALPVRDLTCGTAVRDFPDTPAGSDVNLDELMYWYAGKLLSMTPCMRMNDRSRRAGLYDDKHLRAIIYHTIQFCDFYGFEHASMPRRVPVLKIETDYTQIMSGQIETRLQAFFESCDLLAKRQAPPDGNAGMSRRSDIEMPSKHCVFE
jgi:hypothetical protein